MAAEQELLTPNEYITHHLQNLTNSTVGDKGFWVFHLDTFWVSLILGFIFVFAFGLAARGASVDKPSRFQLFVEWIIEMVHSQVKEIFHGKSTLVAPLALTVFCWILMMNAMDFLPVDLLPSLGKLVGLHHLRVVPTADINQGLAMSLSVIVLSIFLGIQAKGPVGFIVEFFTAPFHAESMGMKIALMPLNFFMQLVEYGSRCLSLALRLVGNMFAGELVFMLIALLPWWCNWIPGSIWALFHILIVVLQAYIFMMLTIVYCGLAVEEH